MCMLASGVSLASSGPLAAPRGSAKAVVAIKLTPAIATPPLRSIVRTERRVVGVISFVSFPKVIVAADAPVLPR